MENVEKIGENFRQFCAENNISCAVSSVILEDGAVAIMTFPNSSSVHPMTYVGLGTHLNTKLKDFMK